MVMSQQQNSTPLASISMIFSKKQKKLLELSNYEIHNFAF